MEEFEEERYMGNGGAELKIVLPYCNVGPECTPVTAANVMDGIAEKFLDLVGR